MFLYERIAIFSNKQNNILYLKGWIILKLVSNENFKEMLELGFIKRGDFATTMKSHSKARRHKHYIREDKYEKYLKYKANQKKNS